MLSNLKESEQMRYLKTNLRNLAKFSVIIIPMSVILPILNVSAIVIFYPDEFLCFLGMAIVSSVIGYKSIDMYFRWADKV
jgi:hypothetical protein